VKLASPRAKKSEDVFSQMGEAEGANIQLIVKADVQGSAERCATRCRSCPRTKSASR
jgi:translation initiation factor IF-2